jgi:hypothetical protein
MPPKAAGNGTAVTVTSGAVTASISALSPIRRAALSSRGSARNPLPRSPSYQNFAARTAQWMRPVTPSGLSGSLEQLTRSFSVDSLDRDGTSCGRLWASSSRTAASKLGRRTPPAVSATSFDRAVGDGGGRRSSASPPLAPAIFVSVGISVSPGEAAATGAAGEAVSWGSEAQARQEEGRRPPSRVHWADGGKTPPPAAPRASVEVRAMTARASSPPRVGSTEVGAGSEAAGSEPLESCRSIGHLGGLLGEGAGGNACASLSSLQSERHRGHEPMHVVSDGMRKEQSRRLAAASLTLVGERSRSTASFSKRDWAPQLQIY